jgi:Kef-type K+ transport system membrane component KefB
VGRLLFIVLFVITGASLPFDALVTAGWAGLALAAARAAGKLGGVFLVAPMGGLNARQTVGLGLALLPMSSLSLLLAHDISKLSPALGADLMAVFLGALIVMEVLGPLAVQAGFRLAGETLEDAEEAPAKSHAA